VKQYISQIKTVIEDIFESNNENYINNTLGTGAYYYLSDVSNLVEGLEEEADIAELKIKLFNNEKEIFLP